MQPFHTNKEKSQTMAITRDKLMNLDATEMNSLLAGMVVVQTVGANLGSAYTQTYATAAKTVPAATVAAAVTTPATTGGSTYGFTQAQADAIPVAINANAADILALKKVVNALIDDLQAMTLVG